MISVTKKRLVNYSFFPGDENNSEKTSFYNNYFYWAHRTLHFNTTTLGLIQWRTEKDHGFDLQWIDTKKKGFQIYSSCVKWQARYNVLQVVSTFPFMFHLSHWTARSLSPRAPARPPSAQITHVLIIHSCLFV